MQTFKVTSKAERSLLKASATRLKAANQLLAATAKEIEAAKKFLADWLRENRGVDVDQMEVGDAVAIDGVIQIEIDAQNKLDQAGLLAAEPELHAKFKREFAVRRFKPLV